jgi:hypothetical protein
LCDGFRTLCVAIHDHDGARAIGSESPHQRAPDPARAAGHDAHSIADLHVTSPDRSVRA